MNNTTKKQIVIITSGQPSANPRVVKEAIALAAAGYFVTVIYAPLSPWGDEYDKELFLSNKSIKWVKAGIHSVQYPKKYKLVRLRRRVNEMIFKYANAFSNAENAYVLYAQELTKKAKRIKADIYIAHNLGALPAAVKAAKKFKTAAAFDAEDYHRGEMQKDSLQYSIAIKIEDKFIPQLEYLSAASPLIAEAYQHLYPQKKIETINNVFSIKFLNQKLRQEKNELSLFWFSQTIGKERGLEDVCKALDLSGNENIKLYLLGSSSDEIKTYLKGFFVTHPGLHKNLFFLPPCHPDKIFEIAAGFDIGLALEQHISLNREYCLTNKLFTYILAGNPIIASDTKAQKKLLGENAGIGFIYESGNVKQLAELINKLFNSPEIVKEYRNNILELAKNKFNIEEEADKLKKLVADVVN